MTYLVFTNCTIQWCFCNQNEYVSSTWQAAAGLHSSFIALLIALIKWAGQRATIKIFLPEKNLKFQCWYERLLLFSWPKMEHFCLHFNREKTQIYYKLSLNFVSSLSIYSRRNLVMPIFVFSWKHCCYCDFRAQTRIKWKIWKFYILWSI